MDTEIKTYHERGLSNRAIGRLVGLHHNTITARLKKMGLKSRAPQRAELILVGKDKAKCSKCGESKDLDEYILNRRGQKYEYRFTYCKECRKRQLNDNLNNNKGSFLGNSYNKTKVRAKKNKIPFTISKEEFIELYKKQEGRCFYTDIDLVCRAGEGKNKHSLSVDKIIPEKGYIDGNVVLCSNIVNTCKNNINIDELKEWMPGWHKRVVEMWRARGLKCFQVEPGNF